LMRWENVCRAVMTTLGQAAAEPQAVALV
jgi:hypothetical protein